MRLVLLFSSTLFVSSRAFYGVPDSTGGQLGNQVTDPNQNLEQGFKSVMGELNAMHGFMISSEQSAVRQAQETRALQSQNSQEHDEAQRLQQQLQKLQQQLQQARQENANEQAKNQQIQSNYQKLSTASKKLAQQYKVMESRDIQLQQKDQQEANQISSLNKEKSGLLGALRKFKGIISAQSQELDSAISGAGTVNSAMPDSISVPQAAPQPVASLMPTMPDPAQLPDPAPLPQSAPVAPVQAAAVDPLPSLPEAPPAVEAPITPSNSVPSVSSTSDTDFGPLELGPPAQASAPAQALDKGKQNLKGKKAAPQQSSLEKDMNSLSDVRKADDAAPLPGMDPDVSKIAQADDQVLQMARDAGFLPSA